MGAITVDPADPRRIFVAAAGSLYNAGSDRGVYRYTGGGATWERILAGANVFTGATENQINPLDRDNVYVLRRQRAQPLHRRRPDLDGDQR